MGHRFHEIAVNSEGTKLYAAIADQLQVYDLKSGQLLKSCTPDLSRTEKVQKPKNAKVESPASTDLHYLTLSHGEKFIVATTYESKSVLVFDSSSLELISAKGFPKRPSSIDITKDDSTLVVADKFGDVYAVPLMSDSPIVVADNVGENDEQTSIEPIMGHVAMLVDLIIADRDGSSHIISADRDEHIRVTRYPQSNIIERWLFGHRAFVSQLCLLSWSSQHLVSGGGDDCIFLWDWTTGKMIDQFNMRPVVQEYFTDLHKSPSSSSNYEITVSKIISLPNLRQILVLCEGMTALINLSIESESIKYKSTIVCQAGKIIDITADKNNNLYVSTDCDDDKGLVQTTCLNDTTLKAIDLQYNLPKQQRQEQSCSLYNIRQLRKRKGE